MILALLWGVAAPLSLAAPLITEFMADNETVLADEDGDYSDWIEIHNPGGTSIELEGWHLTDNDGNLDKWAFPSVTLEPGGFLVVFASGKDRSVPGSELHTNFQLNSGGEYLAIVEPDGATVAQEYAPEYPGQDPDRGYGLAFEGVPVIEEGADAQFLVPSDGALGTTWTESGFAPAGWSNGETGLGYGLQIPGMTVRDVHSTVSLTSLSRADAALAGNNVEKETVTVTPVCNFLDTGGDGRFGNNLPFPGGGGDDYTVQVTGTIIIPTSGTWTFGLNSDDGGRIRIDGVNVMVDATLHGPEDHFGRRVLQAGPHTIEAMFWERSGGAEMELFAARGSFTSFNSNFKLVGDTVNGGLPVFTSPAGTNGAGLVATDVEEEMRNENSSLYLRIPFDINDPTEAGALSLSMRYDDGFVAYLNGTRVASSNVANGVPAWNARATAAREGSEALEPEIFNLTEFSDLLNEGTDNVLAIHGLNIDPTDDSFLLLPKLLSGGVQQDESFYFDDPTPGSINSTPSSRGKVEDTKFNPNRGFYSRPIRVEITSETPGASIRYTTNGSTPTPTNGTPYTGPISISSTTTLRAMAYKTGMDSTNVDTQTYLFTDDIIRQSSSAPPGWPSGSVNGQVYRYGMNSGVVNSNNPAIGGVQQVKDALVSIPTLSIVLDQAGLTSSGQGIYSNPGSSGYAWEREASLELIHPPGWVDPDGNSEGFQTGCGLRIRGGFSRRTQNPKHSFRLFFRGEYGNGRLNYKLFGDEGADEFDKIDLRGPQNYSWAQGGTSQNSFIRDTWSRDLQGEMGHPYKRSRWYHLYLNGIYWGMCETDERAEANYGEIYFGGDQLDYDVVKSFGSVTDGNRSSYQRLWEKWQAGFSSNTAYFNIQGRSSNGNPNPTIEKLVDIENLIDYMIITYYTGDRDGPGSRYTQPRPNNYFGVYNRVNPDGYKFFEHDSEHSLGTGENNMVTPSTRSSSLNDFNPHTLHERLANQNLEYRMKFSDHVAKYCYNDGLLTDEAGIERVNRRADTINQAIFAHSARWGDTNRSHVSWLNAVQGVRNFITGRVPTMIGQLRSVGWYPDIDPPTYSQHGGSIPSNQALLIEGGPGTIYYTVDGQDPRRLGGSVLPGARVFQGNTTTESLVSAGSTWKYLDNGSNQGTAWRNPGFNDSSWESGAGELGYGDGGEATTVSFGPSANNKYVTTYFRHKFNANNVGDYTRLTLGLRRDDGAIVYLNGNEVARSNMPGGEINYLTNSQTFAGGADESTYFPINIPTDELRNGENTLAVEVHQFSRTSSDMSFDLTLDGIKITTANPLVFTEPGAVVVKSRIRNGSEWSALTEATFVVDAEPANKETLAVSEIHYRPSTPAPDELQAGFNSGSDFEFIELLNISPLGVDLGGMEFTTGIEFSFDESLLGRTMAPGQRILLVNDLAAFELRYGSDYPVAGEYSGDLNNDGEQLVITDAAGEVVLDFTYNDADPWPASADGDGYSLVLINPESLPEPSAAASWRTSAVAGGSPGASDSVDYLSWKGDVGIDSDTGDPDSDGLTNFMEYALGSDPLEHSPEFAPQAGIRSFLIDEVSREYLVIDIRRRLGADAVTVTPQFSSDLLTWSGGTEALVPVSVVNNNDGTETLTYRSVDPVSTEVNLFVRGQFLLSP